VTVDNFLLRHVIPWADLAEINVGNGLVFRLRDGRKVGSVSYGGSVGGALAGYPRIKRAAARMQAARAQFQAGSPEQPTAAGHYRRIEFSPRALLCIVAVFEAIALLSLLIR